MDLLSGGDYALGLYMSIMYHIEMGIIDDSWAMDPSSHNLHTMLSLAEDSQEELETIVHIAEVQTVYHTDAPSLNLMLASIYQKMPEELSEEIKYQIELDKLNVLDKAYILNMPNDSQSIIQSWGRNPDPSQGVRAATDLLHRAHMQVYLSKGNAERAVLHLNDAIVKSEKNSDLYDNLIGSLTMLFLNDERLQPYMPSVAMTMKYHRKEK